MSISREVLKALACPRCGNSLHYTKEEVLFCIPCRLCYPIEEGIPNLSLEEALLLSHDGRILPREITAIFSIESGPDRGGRYLLDRGTCKAIGRKMEDPAQTQIFTVDFTMSLDEQTKKLIKNYITKRIPKKKKVETTQGAAELGTYQRLPDLILSDSAVSRLHAMIFHDEGGVGILDLVSRNGTFINGREVEAYLLKNGDEIRIGNTVIKFSMKA